MIIYLKAKVYQVCETRDVDGISRSGDIPRNHGIKKIPGLRNPRILRSVYKHLMGHLILYPSHEFFTTGITILTTIISSLDSVGAGGARTTPEFWGSEKGQSLISALSEFSYYSKHPWI